MLRQQLLFIVVVRSFLLGVQISVQSYSFDKVSDGTQPVYVSHIRGSLYIWKSVSFEQKLKSVARLITLLRIVVEELKEISVLEVLFKVLLRILVALDSC